MEPYGHRLISKEAPSAWRLLGVISMGMQWDGEWSLNLPRASFALLDAIASQGNEKEEAMVPSLQWGARWLILSHELLKPSHRRSSSFLLFQQILSILVVNKKSVFLPKARLASVLYRDCQWRQSDCYMWCFCRSCAVAGSLIQVVVVVD